jgi:hypothetical protein
VVESVIFTSGTVTAFCSHHQQLSSHFSPWMCSLSFPLVPLDCLDISFKIVAECRCDRTVGIRKDGPRLLLHFLLSPLFPISVHQFSHIFILRLSFPFFLIALSNRYASVEHFHTHRILSSPLPLNYSPSLFSLQICVFLFYLCFSDSSLFSCILFYIFLLFILCQHRLLYSLFYNSFFIFLSCSSSPSYSI